MTQSSFLPLVNCIPTSFSVKFLVLVYLNGLICGVISAHSVLLRETSKFHCSGGLIWVPRDGVVFLLLQLLYPCRFLFFLSWVFAHLLKPLVLYLLCKYLFFLWLIVRYFGLVASVSSFQLPLIRISSFWLLSFCGPSDSFIWYSLKFISKWWSSIEFPSKVPIVLLPSSCVLLVFWDYLVSFHFLMFNFCGDQNSGPFFFWWWSYCILQ